MTPVAVYLPGDGSLGPGRLGAAALDVRRVEPSGLVLPEATIRDERGGELFGIGSLVLDPASGGGPLAEPSAQRAARAFGVVNTAFHVQRALRFATARLGRELPHLRVRIGMHDAPHRWGGGHYRLPDPAAVGEDDSVNADGEVHLGGGRVFLPQADGLPYFHAPAHNAAIVYHEVGHHLCRHTADFRLNRLRPPDQQMTGKTAIDEGTADLIAAILWQTPDIYRWHRAATPEWDQRRRQLSPQWTMAHFVGAHEHDQHADGTIWASACWSAREDVTAAGFVTDRFDALLFHGLDLFGRTEEVPPGGVLIDVTQPGRDRHTDDALRPRRHFSRLLAAMLAVDPELAPLVAAAMARHGIHLSASNDELAAAARADARQRIGQ